MSMIWKERRGGLSLLVLAGLTAVFFFFGQAICSRVQEAFGASEDSPAVITAGNKSGFPVPLVPYSVPTGSNCGQIIMLPDSAQAVPGNDEIPASQDGGVAENKMEVSEQDSEGLAKEDRYAGLKEDLERYCRKKFNTKKCRKYLLEAKELSKDDGRYKKLYDKYHFQKKKKKRRTESSPAVAGLTVELVVTAEGKSDARQVPANPGMNVLDLMKASGISYAEDSNGMIDQVGGGEKNAGNMSWMLYVCKDNKCGLSGVGASDCLVESYDRIEWRYLDWTKLDW